MNNTTRMALVGTHDVAFLEEGVGQDRPTVLLLHGASFTKETWLETGTIPLLAESGFHVLAVDLPGFGESPSDEEPHHLFLGRFLDAVDAGRAALLSPSMSGSFSLPALARHPERYWAWVGVAPVGVLQFERELRGCEVPVLLMRSAEDHVLSAHDAEDLVARVADGRLSTYPGHVHPLYLEHTERFHRELLDFLRSARTQSASR